MRLAWLAALGASVVLGSACLVEIRKLQPGAGGAGGATGGGAASSSGSGAGPTSGGGDAPGACPDGMIHITDPEFAPADFCIDPFEITQREYAAFIAAVGNDVSQTDQPSQCATNMHLQQEGAYCPSNRQAPDEPVNCVDWCDAWAYCHHFGKRLCGSISNGGPLQSGDPGSNDEWEFACSNGLRQDFPYGNTPELCACYFPRSWEMEDPNGLCGNDSLKNFNAHNDVGTLPRVRRRLSRAVRHDGQHRGVDEPLPERRPRRRVRHPAAAFPSAATPTTTAGRPSAPGLASTTTSAAASST